MVKDIVPGSAESLPSIVQSFKATATLNGLLFFPVYVGDNGGFDLWKSDGTSAGTSMVKNIPTSNFASLRNFHVHQNVLYFTVIKNNINAQQVWRRDGTEVGTFSIYTCSAPSGQNFQIVETVAMCENIYVNGANATIGQELFKYSSVLQQVSVVRDINVGLNFSSPYHLTVVNGQLYFTANAGA